MDLFTIDKNPPHTRLGQSCLINEHGKYLKFTRNDTKIKEIFTSYGPAGIALFLDQNNRSQMHLDNNCANQLNRSYCPTPLIAPKWAPVAIFGHFS